MNDKQIEVLKEYFGYQSFRPGQDEIIKSIIYGRDVLAVMPTGAGKSLCFQIPALMFDGITIVISPLISLMRDQVTALTHNGVSAAFINSSLTQSQTEKALFRASQGLYKIIYVAPERLGTYSFLNFAKSADISMVAVDEAHCVSHWGQDFRPSYLNISSFTASLPKRPVIAAFTATATEEVKADIIRMLDLRDPLNMTTSFNRENLYFEVRRPKSKYAELESYLSENKDKSGIVYCSTRKNVELVTEKLNKNGFDACAYHAGIPQLERTIAQEDFVYDRRSIIVATNAFGMGIDKSNVAFVVHYNMPKNMESYYQEAGRAGRDGSPAECILFFNAQDVITNKFLIETTDSENVLSEEELQEIKVRDYKRLRLMETYCKTTDCLRQYILDYFGDKEPTSCENCGNCLSEHELVDITSDAQKILSCVYRMDGRFGMTVISDVLYGSKNKRIIESKLDKMKSYGIMDDRSIYEIRVFIEFLLQNDYLSVSNDGFPVISVTKEADEILFNGKKISMPIMLEEKKESTEKEDKSSKRTVIDNELFAKLKELRIKIAKTEGVPAFVIFSDATLVDMCARIPCDNASFLEVSGVGQVKLEKYGTAFLEVLKNYKPMEDSEDSDNSETANDSSNADMSAFIKANYEFFDEPVGIAMFMDRINAIVLQKRDKGIPVRKITEKLIADGYIEDREIGEQKTRISTEKGEISGVSAVKKIAGDGREYYRIYYNTTAQKILLNYVLDMF